VSVLCYRNPGRDTDTSTDGRDVSVLCYRNPGRDTDTSVLMTRIRVLSEAVPSNLVVLTAPFDWIVDTHTKLQPDLLVFRRADVDADALRVAPLLAVEVLSPSTRRLDLGTKKLAIAAGGAAHYWVVDPATPSITAFDLAAGEFVEVATATADAALRITRPFAITVVPARLVD